MTSETHILRSTYNKPINIYSLKPINAPFHEGVLPKEGSADVVGERGAGADGKHPRFGPRAGERGDITGGEDT